MADNVAITQGSGTNIAADDIASVLYQRIKMVVGADGTNDGDVSKANPLPVALMSSMSQSVLVAGGSISSYVFGGSLSVFGAGGSISSYVFGGSLSAFNAGGSLSAFQGGGWLVSTFSGSNMVASGQYLPSNVSLTSQQHIPLKTDGFGNLMVNPNVKLQRSANYNRFYTQGSMASITAAPGAGMRYVVREIDFSANATVSLKIVQDQGGTPVTVWGPHYFLPYAGLSKTQSYIPLTANQSLGVDIQPTGTDATIDLRVETEAV